MKKISDFVLENKKVIIRCDFNVPIKNNVITDDTRIVESLPTILYAISKKAKVILFSHLGRIKTTDDILSNSLKLVAVRLEELLKQRVFFSKETRGEDLEKAIAALLPGEVLLMENTRYEDLDGQKESNNDELLGSYWASLGDIFINDAFGVSHRACASTVGISKYLPSGSGFLIEKEIMAIEELDNPQRPYIIILGGSKVSDKINLIAKLITKADYLLIGGAMAYTFLKAQGYEVGKSLVEENNISFCKDLLNKYKDKIILPIDSVVTLDISSKKHNIEIINNISYNEVGVDIGPETVNLFKKYCKKAKTVLWNGPLGMYELDEYKEGTVALLEYLTNDNIKTFLGGGDIVAAATINGYKDKIYHISTGGGALLEYLEGKTLPGINILK